MKILILGSEGFIGKHCVDHFISKQYAIVGIDLFEQPSKNYSYTKVSRLSSELNDIFLNDHFDAVINCAGSGNVPYSMAHPMIDFEANCLDVAKVLDILRSSQKNCCYIHLSSAAVYGNPSQLPINEGDSLHPLSPYGWHKLIAEKLCAEYTGIYGLRTAVVRPFSVYGPYLKKQMFWDIYQKIKNNLPDNLLTLLGTGEESRDYIHVKDLIQGIELILNKGKLEGEIYNLASGVEITIKEAVTAFLEAVEYTGKYVFNGQVREGDPLNWQADIKKIRQLGFVPNFTIHSGMKNLASWLKSESQNIF